MNAPEAAMLLGLCAAYDRRTVGEADARAWAEALPDVAYDDARHAVVKHYRNSRQWIMPSDVLENVKVVYEARLAEYGPIPEPPRDIEPWQRATWQATFRRQIESGADEQTADKAACAAADFTRPADDPLRSFYQTKLARYRAALEGRPE